MLSKQLVFFILYSDCFVCERSMCHLEKLHLRLITIIIIIGHFSIPDFYFRNINLLHVSAVFPSKKNVCKIFEQLSFFFYYGLLYK